MSPQLAQTLDEIGRLGLTHALDPTPLAAALCAEPADAAALLATGTISASLQTIDDRVAAYLLGILVRLEVRCRGDRIAIRAALDRPNPDLGGLSITEALLGRPDLAGLAVIREAAGTIAVPRVKMWRVADTYS